MKPVLVLVLAGCWTSSPAPPATVAQPTPIEHVRHVEDTYDQSTPKRALASFLRAVERERYDIVLRFVPDAYREFVDEKKLREQFSAGSVRESLAELGAAPGEPTLESEDEATMSYGAHNRLRMIREHGVWRIKDLD